MTGSVLAVVPGVLVVLAVWYLGFWWFWPCGTWGSGGSVVPPRGQRLPHLGPPAVELLWAQEPAGHGALQAPLHLPAEATAAVQPELSLNQTSSICSHLQLLELFSLPPRLLEPPPLLLLLLALLLLLEPPGQLQVGPGAPCSLGVQVQLHVLLQGGGVAVDDGAQRTRPPRRS
ncbi:hypothetical protein EYF80_055869 [Liparis tanakae]|uniref:Uncharacterized protein n=1 Tax=Liparis tanakae TaxID=230148 RepID=A0A4Z2EYC4_9TELE|nr:hypothetical protein EYF80_055869 [Liparis tanakae]